MRKPFRKKESRQHGFGKHALIQLPPPLATEFWSLFCCSGWHFLQLGINLLASKTIRAELNGRGEAA